MITLINSSADDGIVKHRRHRCRRRGQATSKRNNKRIFLFQFKSTHSRPNKAFDDKIAFKRHIDTFDRIMSVLIFKSRLNFQF